MSIRGSLPLAMNIHELISPIQTVDLKTIKIRQKLGFKKFCIFWGLKPSPGHGLPLNVKFCPTALVVWEPCGVGQTDRQTDGQTDGVTQFPGALYDNHPFGVDKYYWAC